MEHPNIHETVFKALDKMDAEMKNIMERQLKANGLFLDYKNRKLVEAMKK